MIEGIQVKASDDPKVIAATSQCEKEVWIGVLVDTKKFSGWCYELYVSVNIGF